MNLQTTKVRKLNYFEKAGLIAILKKELNYDIERQYCGRNSIGLLLVQNHEVALHPEGYPILGSVGVDSTGMNVILEYLAQDEETNCYFEIARQHLLKKTNPIKYLKTIE